MPPLYIREWPNNIQPVLGDHRPIMVPVRAGPVPGLPVLPRSSLSPYRARQGPPPISGSYAYGDTGPVVPIMGGGGGRAPGSTLPPTNLAYGSSTRMYATLPRPQQPKTGGSKGGGGGVAPVTTSIMTDKSVNEYRALLYGRSGGSTTRVQAPAISGPAIPRVFKNDQVPAGNSSSGAARLIGHQSTGGGGGAATARAPVPPQGAKPTYPVPHYSAALLSTGGGAPYYNNSGGRAGTAGYPAGAAASAYHSSHNAAGGGGGGGRPSTTLTYSYPPSDTVGRKTTYAEILRKEREEKDRVFAGRLEAERNHYLRKVTAEARKTRPCDGKIRVAVFHNQYNNGIHTRASNNCAYALSGSRWKERDCPVDEGHSPESVAAVTMITARQIQSGYLNARDYDVLLMPGGYSAHQSSALGSSGRQAIRHFVQVEGGGYVGICAGAYLACSQYNPHASVGLVNADVFQHAAFKQGEGHCLLRMSGFGRELMWEENGKGWQDETEERESNVIEPRYNNGPLMKVGPGVHRLANFTARCNAQVRMCRRSPQYVPDDSCAVCLQTSGKGAAILISPHLESSHAPPSNERVPGIPRFRRWLQRAVMAVANHVPPEKKLTPTPPSAPPPVKAKPAPVKKEQEVTDDNTKKEDDDDKKQSLAGMQKPTCDDDKDKQADKAALEADGNIDGDKNGDKGQAGNDDDDDKKQNA